jgi:hypothetical protein
VNIPTEGFVLNKKVGGNKYSWNTRQTYCRVYDPRGFEFEISIPNLLFILECTNSIKGKGLEGEFVYSWDGKDLILLPTNCEDYKLSQKFTDLQKYKIASKDLIKGATYLNNREEESIYLGKFDYYFTDKKDHTRKNEKRYIFYINNRFISFKNLNAIKMQLNNFIVTNYSDLVDSFLKTEESSKIESFEFIKKQITHNSIDELYKNITYNDFLYSKIDDKYVIRYKLICKYKVYYDNNSKNTWYLSKFETFKLDNNQLVNIKDRVDYFKEIKSISELNEYFDINLNYENGLKKQLNTIY